MVPPSCVEVRIEDADLRDLVDRKIIPCGRLANGLRTRSVDDTERLRRVVADVRVNPRHAFVCVPLDDAATALRSLLVARNSQAVGERALDDVPRHLDLLVVHDLLSRSTVTVKHGALNCPAT